MTNELFVSFLLLSVTGGFVSAVFLVFVKKIYQLTSAKFTVFLNAIVLLTFVIPFHKLRSWYDGSDFVFSHFRLLVLLKGEGLRSSFYQWAGRVQAADRITEIWICGMIAYLFFEGILYWRFIRKVKKESFSVFHTLWVDTLGALCMKEQIKAPVTLLAGAGTGQPCVMGFGRKYIVIPADLLNVLNEAEIEMILRHEIMHIKRKDLWIKLGILLFNSINWFNPFYYLLKQNLFEWIELGCDEDITDSMDTYGRKTYMNVLIRILEEESARKEKRYAFYFGNTAVKNLKRRIYNIMKKRNKKGIAARIMILTAGILTVFVGTVLAKETDVAVNSIFSNRAVALRKDEVHIGSMPEPSISFLEIDSDKIKEQIDAGTAVPLEIDSGSSCQVFLKDGSILEINGVSVNSTKHTHKYEDTNVSVHKKYNDGSCKTTIYEALYCAVCDTCWYGDILNEYTQKRCTHA